MYVCVCVCVCARVRACVRACVSVSASRAIITSGMIWCEIDPV